jgi:hypothetical protein
MYSAEETPSYDMLNGFLANALSAAAGFGVRGFFTGRAAEAPSGLIDLASFCSSSP